MLSRATYYEHGNKASRLLAHQLRRQAASRTIPQIKDPAGTLQTDPVTINSVFYSFYSSLYKSESSPDTSEMTSFLDSLNFPLIDPDAAKKLDSPLTAEEIIFAMKNMQNNKAPGPDGFPIEFFFKDFRIN